MPEIQNAVWPCTEKARAIDHVRFAFKEGLQQKRIFTGVVFEVCVLNNDEIAGRLENSATERRSLALVLRLKKYFDLRLRSLQVRKNFAGAIARTVVYAQQLDIERCGQNSLDDGSQGRALVIDGHDY